MSIAVNICNDALNHLGAEAINSLSDNTNVARTCNRQYPIARDYILRQHPWNFALTREEITSSGVANKSVGFGESHTFIVPANSVRIYKVVDASWKPIRYKLEKGIIYALPQIQSDILVESSMETSTIYLLYVDRSIDESLYDPVSKKAIAAQLAADMCYKITQSANLMAGLINLAKDYVAEARSYDSMVGEPQDLQFNYFDDARRSNHEIYPKSDFF